MKNEWILIISRAVKKKWKDKINIWFLVQMYCLDAQISPITAKQITSLVKLHLGSNTHQM